MGLQNLHPLREREAGRQQACFYARCIREACVYSGDHAMNHAMKWAWPTLPGLLITGALSCGAEPEPPLLSPEVIRAGAMVIGLEFSEKETEMMARQLSGRLKTYEALRAESFPNELAPAFVFHPLPRGFQIPKEEKSAGWQPDQDFKRQE